MDIIYELDSDSKQYHIRIRYKIAILLIIGGIIFSFYLKTSDTFLLFLTALVVFLYGTEIIVWNRFYITKVSSDNNILYFEYFDYRTLKSISCELNSTTFQIKYLWYKAIPPHPYLHIHFKNGLTLNQHIDNFWTEYKMRELIKLIEHRIAIKK